MWLLLDECMLVDFRHDLAAAGHVETAKFGGLVGLRNGALLDAMVGRFDVLVTVDGSLHYQQIIPGRLVSVLLLRAPSNDIDDLRPLVPAAIAALTTIQSGQVVEI